MLSQTNKDVRKMERASRASGRIRGFGQECPEAGVSGQRTSQKKGAQKGVEEEVSECGERCR